MEISCVVPAFETAGLLRACLNSILLQEAVEFEIIVSDNSRSTAVRDLIAGDPALSRVRYRRGPRSGNPVENWNAGLAAARAPICVLIHHDERLLYPRYLRDALGALARPGVAAVIGGVEVAGLDRPSRFALAGRLSRFLGRPTWLLPAINWIGPTAAFVFRRGPSFDANLVQLVDVAFYRRVLRGGRGAFIERTCVGSLGHHRDQISARIDPVALARAELPRLCGGAELAAHRALLRLRSALA